MAQPITVRIKKKTDGSAALSCTRADGSTTWHRQNGQQGLFFPFHDLTHYAVEVTLGFRQAFYGLIAEGWDVTDFGPPWPKGRIPPEAGDAELIVGFLDSERAAGTLWAAADMNEKAQLYYAQHKVDRSIQLTDAELQRIRAFRGELFGRWRAVPDGDALELPFPLEPAGR